jgi:hypothetical protein
MVVTALRQRRITDLLCETKKPPGKTGRFLFAKKTKWRALINPN